MAAQRTAEHHQLRAADADIALGASRAAEQRLQQNLAAAEKVSLSPPLFSHVISSCTALPLAPKQHYQQM